MTAWPETRTRISAQHSPTVNMQAIKKSAIQSIAVWLDVLSQPQLLISQITAAKNASPRATPKVPSDLHVACTKNIHTASSTRPTTAWSG